MSGALRPNTGSLTLRLCAVLAAGAVALSALVTFAGAEEARARQQRELHAHQRSLCESVAARAAALLEHDDAQRLPVLASTAADLAAARVLVLDSAGLVRLDTGQAEQGQFLALMTSDGSSSRPLGDGRFEVMAPALGNDGFVGEVRLRYTLASLPPLEFPWSLFGLVFLCSATLVTLAGWMVHSWVVRLRRLAARARRIARGDETASGSREIGAVAEVSDAMLELSEFGAESARRARDGVLRLARELVHALELRGHVAPGHPERVRRHALDLAHALDIDQHEVDTIAEAALVFELGKAGVRPSAFVQGANLGQLELESLREHPARGASLLAALPELEAVARVVRHHCERWDGNGHPDGLRAERIPAGSRVLAIVSTYDELMTGDGRRPQASWPDALDSLREQAGAMFDPGMVAAFEQLVRRAPPRLHSSRAMTIPTPVLAFVGGTLVADAITCEDPLEILEAPLEVLRDEPEFDEE